MGDNVGMCTSCPAGKLLVDGTCVEGLCEESSWPDLDHGLVCGDCKVLVDNFARVYGTCSQYCESMGFECVGAWEEDADTWGLLCDLTCDETLASSDAICECSPNT